MSDQKQTSFKNRPKLTAKKKQGKGMGTVLRPTLQHIGNIQKLDHSEHSILKLFMTGKGKLRLYLVIGLFYFSTLFIFWENGPFIYVCKDAIWYESLEGPLLKKKIFLSRYYEKTNS